MVPSLFGLDDRHRVTFRYYDVVILQFMKKEKARIKMKTKISAENTAEIFINAAFLPSDF